MPGSLRDFMRGDTVRNTKFWKKVNKNMVIRCIIILGGAAVFILVLVLILHIAGVGSDKNDKNKEETVQSDQHGAEKLLPKLNFTVDLLTPNKYSRPQLALKHVNAVVVHYTANPGTDAKDNRNYFNNLPDINATNGTNTFASSHFIVGLEGNIVQCIPLAEMAYASNDRNSDTVAIECCHPKKDGKFTNATYEALLELLTYVCIRYELDPQTDIIRHYDITGKMCPKYYVKHPDKWEQLKKDAAERIQATKKELQG